MLNATAGATITACFARQVARMPDAVALAGAHAVLTYDALNCCANAMAQRLQDAGVMPGDRVLVCLSRSVEAVLAFLAVLKAGAVYVPLDPGYPDELKRTYLAASGARHAVVGCAGHGLVGGPGLTLVSTAGALIRPTGTVAEIDRVRDGDCAAYVMFTSGSMGRPKGVVIAHRGVVRLVSDTDYICIGDDDAVLQLSNIGFDASTFEVWGALLNGARLVVYELPWFDPNALARSLVDDRITILWLTAALFHLIARQDLSLLRPLRVLLAGGDVLRAEAINAVLDAHAHLTVINGYGPTENTTFTCCYAMTRSNRPGADVPIGRPIRGTEVHVLDETLAPVPDGVAGELCTSGLGVAIGYLDAPAATNAAFVTHPAATGSLYRTGDLVCREPDGLLHYLGRRDRIVKIRGFRVALDDIQASIAGISGVEENLVQVALDRNNEKAIHAYVQSPNPAPAMALHVKRELRKLVPSFMVPDTLTICARLPINANGKLDRNALMHGAQLPELSVQVIAAPE